MRPRAGVVSDRGLVRQTNEDSYLVRRGLYAVCDGMGGARAGEVASEMACRGLSGLDPSASGPDELRTAIREANRAIAGRSMDEEHLLGMGTTLTAALFGGDVFHIAHVGDSRAYLLHDGTLTQLTDDHSWVGEMVRRGELTAAQAALHPHRSVITKALGTDAEAEPDLLVVPVAPGDRVLLCSDGLTGMVSDPEIAAIMGRDTDPQTVAATLVEAALAEGGEDNVTVVVIDVSSEGADGSESAEDLGDAGGSEDAEMLLGPTDRGGISPASGGRGRMSRAAVRERLGGRVGPLLRPAGGRSHDVKPATVADGGAGPEESAPAAAPSLASPGPPPAPSSAASPAAVSPAATPAAAAPRPKRRSRRIWIIALVVFVIVVIAAVAGFALFNSTVYYVGTSDGVVALYNGLPARLLGIELSSVVEYGVVDYGSLSPYLQTRVDAHDIVSKEEGQLFLRSLGLQQ